MHNDGPTSGATDVEGHDSGLGDHWNRVTGRRAFLRDAGLAGATALAGTGLFASAASASGGLSDGDIAILRFLAAAEIIERDLWEQYNELGGVNGGNTSYQLALENLDGDMPQYISDNTDDEQSHAAFLNAYLHSHGAPVVNFDRFRTLPSSKAKGAKQIGRLTNLMHLNVDTSWYTRYRSSTNPDLGASFPQAVEIRNQPAIPLDDVDTPPGTLQPVPTTTRHARRMQAIANAAGFHFAMIEQGGAGLYTALSLKASSLEVLRIIVSIGGVEVDHFAVWHDKAGNAVAQPLAGVTDPETGTHFPDLNARNSELFQTNLIFPEPADFIDKNLPACSVIRPSADGDAGPVAFANALIADNLFHGQTHAFFRALMRLAKAAEAAQRTLN
jgi:hypothetical protein